MGRESFHDVLFPEEVSLGARGGPRRRTDIVQLASGREVRRARWAGSKRSWQIALPSLTAQNAARLTAFFEARGGSRYGFAFRDPFDHATGGAALSNLDEVIGIGDGVRTAFALKKTYDGFERSIDLADPLSLKVALDGTEQQTGYALTPSRDEVSFSTPPANGAVVSAGFGFHVPVRFASDELVLELGAKGASAPVIGLVEVVL